MSFYLIKNKTGQYSPMDESDFEASRSVGIGTVVKATAPRNFKFHKKAFALLNLGFSNQSQYTQFEVYRKIVTIKSGFFDEAPGKDGHTYYIPQSLSYDTMSAETFEKWYSATLQVLSEQMDTKTETIRQEIDRFY